ncbi:MAG TPA: TMEM175 family protein [Steroidobacteraceae bacterium]|jgi:uncharacterized membrane protein
MGKGRLEAFSDGVIAIIITIMVLELKVPHGADFGTLIAVVPVLLSYVLSFIYVGIFWTNHHHMLHITERITGRALWANLHLLFWLSLVPFATAWMDENHFASAPVALYGAVLLMAALAYYLFARVLILDNGPDCKLALAFGKDSKTLYSMLIYLSGIAASLFMPSAALIAYVAVAVMWIVPDRRIESLLEE